MLQLPDKIQKILAKFLADLKTLYAEQLISVILYGSAAGEDFVPGRSDINTLIILRQVDFKALKKYQTLQKKYEKLGIVAPLILEPEYIQTSADSFPIEFLDLKNQNQVLYGEDFFSKLEIQLTHLRLQCEQELKGKLIRLRQHFLEVGHSQAKLERLISSSFASLVPVWRNLLRLKNKNNFKNTAEILNQLEKEFGFPAEVFSKVWKFKKQELKLKSQDLQNLFAEYLDKVRELALKVDQIKIL
ncbi:MAG: hypothetical protein A2145_06735 [candidate division Zixibacteria bacterium RBG_16_40_9]|nr:MAG: hypothetical protein A2145_06735 [candidate division Zixibacteria bacterium RBG_16_40_9]